MHTQWLNVSISCGICWTLLHRGLSPYSLAWWSQLSGKLAHSESPKSQIERISKQAKFVHLLVLAARLVLSHVEEKHIFARKLDLHAHWIFWKSAWCSPNYAHVGTVQVQSYLAYDQKHQLYLRPVWLLSLLSSDGDTMPTNRALTADPTWQTWAWHVWLVKATRKIRQKPRSHGPHGPHTVQVLAQNLL